MSDLIYRLQNQVSTHGGNVKLRFEAADRIEELENCHETMLGLLDACDAMRKELEAKLAKLEKEQ